MKAIQKKLAEIYPEKDVEIIALSIKNLIGKYQNLVKPSTSQLTHKDIVLIAYGDHVKTDGEMPLQTLAKFATKYLYDHIDSIHILPFYPYSSDDGFSVIDYYQVNPDLGTWQDVEALAKDYKLMFDAVVNHISSQSKWFQGYLNGKEQYENYFIEKSPDTDLSAVVRPRALPLLSKFKDAKGNTRHIWTTFSQDQIDLNYENPKVLLQVLDVLLFYISKGAKLLRLDAIGFLWKVPGTTSIHLPQTHSIIQLVRLVLGQVSKEVTLVTETNVPHQENISYFGDGTNEAQMVYNFTLPPLLAFSLLKEDTKTLQAWAASLSLPSQQTCFFNFTASHDGVGVRPLQGIVPDADIDFLAKTAKKHGGYISYKNNPDGSQSPYELNCNYLDLIAHPDEEEGVRIKKMLLTQGVALCMPGVPGIYFHSLVGSGNYKKGVEATGMKRTINREKLDYEVLCKELEAPNSFRAKLYKQFLHLIDTRKKYQVFNPFGDFKFPKVHKNVFAIERVGETQKILCLFNFSSKTIELDLGETSGENVLTGLNENLKALKLKAWEQKWICLDA